MHELGTFEDARSRVLANAERMLLGVKRVIAEPVDSVEAGVALLSSLRKQAHEHLNQIQHEQMIVRAAEWLVQHGIATTDTRWLWNPRRGAENGGPDLLGKAGEMIRVCAEVNALEEPVGVIDAQMRRALARLATLEGRRFYFVRTASMKRRAVTKVVKTGCDIAVVQLPPATLGPLLAFAAPITSLAASPVVNPR
jgi:hypothetical protein